MLNGISVVINKALGSVLKKSRSKTDSKKIVLTLENRGSTFETTFPCDQWNGVGHRTKDLIPLPY